MSYYPRLKRLTKLPVFKLLHRIGLWSLDRFPILRTPMLLYSVTIIMLGFVYLLRWPITLTDTDLWYHLNAGRYLFVNGVIPQDSFFSFVLPAREWVDYYWLFQGLVYAIYTYSGYYGLIALRAVVYLAVILLIKRYLFESQASRASRTWMSVLVVLFALAIIPRFVFVRPHILSYLFIVSFIYILEMRPRWALVLPVIAILWYNAHGIFYPVAMLISYAYVIEYFINRVMGRNVKTRDEICRILGAALSMAVIFLPPFGTRLLGVPFTSMVYASKNIAEFKSVGFDQLVSISVSGLTPSWLTIVSLLLITTGLAAITSLVRGKIRISHLIIWIGGLYLLTKGVRLSYTCVLLGLPLLKCNPLTRLGSLRRHVARPGLVVIAAMLLVMPVRFLVGRYNTRPAYPFSSRGLNEGVVTFLNRVGTGGSLFSWPDLGGYVEWMVYPRYKIFMDMQIPFLFTEDDLYIATHAFWDKGLLERVTSKYDPSFISAPLERSKFKEIIEEFDDYAMVFFDDAEVLYVNERRHPVIAAHYAMEGIDPFELAGKGVEKLMKERKEDEGREEGDDELLRAQMSKLLEIYPSGEQANHIMALISHREGDFQKSISHAQAIIRKRPEISKGYRLLGDARKELGMYTQALEAYRTALRKAGGSEGAKVYRGIGSVYLAREQYALAYKALSKGTDIYGSGTAIDDLYTFAVAARLSQHIKDAKGVLAYLYAYRITDDDVEWKEKVEKEYELLGVDLEDLRDEFESL